jgi:hypothetical protein
MTSIINTLPDFDYLKETETFMNNSSTHNNNQPAHDSSPALSQGEDFKKYQNKIISNLEKTIENVNSKEGFQLNQVDLNLADNGLTQQTNEIIQSNDFTSQQQTIATLKRDYSNTLKEYEDLLKEITNATNNYINRVNPNNPYLNKTLRFTSGELAYVTRKGVLKYIPSVDILNSLSVPKTFTNINLPWNSAWSIPGANIPSNPSLISGTPMTMNQSLGNEGANVFVNTMINNPDISYNGCYADNVTNPLMTFIGGSPTTNPSGGSYTYGMCKQAAIDGGYQYFALQGVDPAKSTGYCAVSNDKNRATQLGNSQVPSGRFVLWSSNTSGQSGNTAILTDTGSLSVINSGGQAIYSTPNANATPSNYFGCYADKRNRAMTAYNNGATSYNLQQCQKAATDGGYKFFALQYANSRNKAQCNLSNDLSESTKYGLAGNCRKLSDGTWTGGGWSNALYNTDPDSNYYLVLDDNGNLSLNRGTGKNDNQGNIWSTQTSGRQNQANPNFAASKGKYGKNFITQGSTLAAGDFIGSPSGNIALVMESGGNLVLYGFTMTTNCQRMTDGNMGSGAGGNALYYITQKSVPSNLSNIAYIDQNSQLYAYPSNNIQYANSYTKIPGMDSAGNDLPGYTNGNSTLEACQTTCNNNTNCAGFAFSNNVCYPKTSGMYPTGSKQVSSTADLYMRNKQPITPPAGFTNQVNNIDTVTYQEYVDGKVFTDQYGLAIATNAQKQKLSQLQQKMDTLTNQLNTLTGKFSDGSTQAQDQLETNVDGIHDYLNGIKNNNKQIKNFDTNIENILQDSDIKVLQQNYNYLFWSILAAGSVLVSMNIVKN